jgi:hypothetical protein
LRKRLRLLSKDPKKMHCTIYSQDVVGKFNLLIPTAAAAAAAAAASAAMLALKYNRANC